MNKFNYTNHSVPLSRRKVEFTSYEQMMECIDENRTVESIQMIDFNELTYDAKLDVYHLDAISYDEDVGEQGIILECPRYAIAQLFRDILGIGDITKFFESTEIVDSKMDRVFNEEEDRVESCTLNLKNLNEILRNTWNIYRIKNKRTPSVHIMRTFDFATINEEGDGRAIVSGRYIHKPDAEVMKLVKDKAEDVNPNIQFANGYATALMTRACFVDKTPEYFGDKEVLLGVSAVNSEFKYASVQLTGYLLIPEIDGEVICKTARLNLAIKHVGNRSKFEDVIKRGVKAILGKKREILNLFNNLSTCSSRSIAIDFNQLNEVGSNALGVQLKMSPKIKDLIKIKEEKGFPSSIEGVALTLMNYAKNNTQSENEKERVNQKIMSILKRPDVFVDNLKESLSRADVIDLNDDNGKVLSVENWI